MDDPFFAEAENKFYNKAVVRNKILRRLAQTGAKPNLVVDKSRAAIQPGKRMSKTGHIYWETRKNRSDVNPKKRI